MKTFKILYNDVTYIRLSRDHQQALHDFMREFNIHWSQISDINQVRDEQVK
jgi:hypothetical protein